MPLVTSYGQKTPGGTFFIEYGTMCYRKKNPCAHLCALCALACAFCFVRRLVRRLVRLACAFRLVRWPCALALCAGLVLRLCSCSPVALFYRLLQRFLDVTLCIGLRGLCTALCVQGALCVFVRLFVFCFVVCLCCEGGLFVV